MAQGNNISFTIDKSLSYSIDKRLDTELNTDVKLGINEWESVFNIIKNDKATATKQYSGGDSDIKNNKNLMVKQNQIYQITQTAWGKIVNIAKQKMGISADDSLIETGEVNNKDINKQEEQSVVQILSNAGISTKDVDINDINKKYQSIKEYYTNNNIEKDSRGLTKEDRIINYVKGLEYKKTEANFASAYSEDSTPTSTKYEIAGVKEAVASYDGKTTESYNNAMQKQNDAFHNAGAQRIELCDSDNDGKISWQELYSQSIKDEEKRLGRALTDQEKNIIKTETINRIAFIDINEDNYLDENEMAAFVWATAKVNDTETSKSASDITFEEWKTAEVAMTLSGYNISELQQNEIDKIVKFRQTLKNGYEGLKR